MVMNASSSDLKAGSCGSNAFAYPDCSTRRKGSHRDLAVRSEGFFFLEDSVDDEPHHFVDACALCMKPLRPNRDIYMYRGNMPFCSEECRQEQIEMDEALEKCKKRASCFKVTKKRPSVADVPKSDTIHVRTGTLVGG